MIFAGCGRIRRRTSCVRSTELAGCYCLLSALDARSATRYSPSVIRTFKHKGIKAFFETGSKAGIQAAHAKRLQSQLAKLDSSKSAADMALPNWHLHQLKGKLAGSWAVSVSGNWRLIFKFEDGDAILVDYLDYH